MLRTFGPDKRKRFTEPKRVTAAKEEKPRVRKPSAPKKKMYIVDGYNVIHSWQSLKEAAKMDLEKAREILMDTLSNYVAFTKTELVLVFDAYLVKYGEGSETLKEGYKVIFTKENQTADAYIEKMMSAIGPNYNITVITGDRLVQYSAVHSGILRMTAKEFEEEIISVGNEITEFVRKFGQGR